MTLNDIERELMETPMGDSAMLHEMLVQLVNVVRGQQFEITKLQSQMAKVHDALPMSADMKERTL